MEPTTENITLFLEDFRDKLNALGDADAIALHLRGLQVQAVCGSPGQCAIAVALTEMGYRGTVGLEAYASGRDELALERFTSAFGDGATIAIGGQED